MARTPISMQQANSLDQDTFVETFGFVFENSPWIAAEAWHDRPFDDLHDLHQALYSVVQRASEEQQVALIRAHPDLAGKAAIAGELGPESTREQASAGLDRLTVDEFATFNRLNGAYREKFDFPFVICVREHTKESILASFAARLHNSREQEIKTALGEIAKIAHLRLYDVIET
jgi:2-oxo-4-hydroxy-4-carboxy-5-ureidoimidazoline decarboxylase